MNDETLRDLGHPYVACPHGGCTLPANHDAAPAPTVDADHRQLMARFWVYYRCEMVGCETVEPHEHGGGPPMREMTPSELGDEG